MGSTRYVFLTAAEGFPSTVFASQVADLLRVLNGAGLRFELLGFDPFFPRNRLTAEGRAKLAELQARLDGDDAAMVASVLEQVSELVYTQSPLHPPSLLPPLPLGAKPISTKLQYSVVLYSAACSFPLN